MTANNISSHGFSRPSSLAYTLDKSEKALGLELSVSRHVLLLLSRSPNPSMFLPTSILGNGIQVSLVTNVCSKLTSK